MRKLVPTIPPFSLERKAKVGNYRVFDVIHSDVKAHDGSVRGDVFTFEMPDWVTVVPITPSGDVLLLWQWRFGTEAFELETPGGVVDKDEAPRETARRELLEETGYVAKRIEPLGVFAPNPALENNRCHAFVAEVDEEPHSARDTSDLLEEIELVRVSASELPYLLDEGQIRHALVVASLERYLRHLRT